MVHAVECSLVVPKNHMEKSHKGRCPRFSHHTCEGSCHPGPSSLSRCHVQPEASRAAQSGNSKDMSVIFSHCFAMVPEIAIGNLSILYANKYGRKIGNIPVCKIFKSKHSTSSEILLNFKKRVVNSDILDQHTSLTNNSEPLPAG